MSSNPHTSPSEFQIRGWNFGLVRVLCRSGLLCEVALVATTLFVCTLVSRQVQAQEICADKAATYYHHEEIYGLAHVNINREAIKCYVRRSEASATADTYVVRHTSGGSLAAFENRFIAMKNQPVEIRGPVCLSSCTMWLSHPSVCVDPETKLGFHGPSNGAAVWITSQITIIPLYHYMPQKKRKRVVNLMATHYRLNGNETLGDWFIQSGAWKHYGIFFKYMTGQEAHDRFGTSLCEVLPVKYVASRGPTR